MLLSGLGATPALAQALEAAASSAEAARDSTAAMSARVGRASYLGDRSIGNPDAGATSMALLLRTLARAAEQINTDC